MRQCSVDGCLGLHEGFGYCRLHYRRFKTRGTPDRYVPGIIMKWLLDSKEHSGDDCLMWPFYRGKSGYAYFTHNGRTSTAGRWMCLLAHGEPPTKKHQAAHSCGRGAFGCVNPRHLRWATPLENGADKVIHGSNKGERHGNAKLTDVDVTAIKSALLTGEIQAHIAERFGVSAPVICLIKKNRSWSHIGLVEAAPVAAVVVGRP